MRLLSPGGVLLVCASPKGRGERMLRCELDDRLALEEVAKTTHGRYLPLSSATTLLVESTEGGEQLCLVRTLPRVSSPHVLDVLAHGESVACAAFTPDAAQLMAVVTTGRINSFTVVLYERDTHDRSGASIDDGDAITRWSMLQGSREPARWLESSQVEMTEGGTLAEGGVDPDVLDAACGHVCCVQPVDAETLFTAHLGHGTPTVRAWHRSEHINCAHRSAHALALRVSFAH